MQKQLVPAADESTLEHVEEMMEYLHAHGVMSLEEAPDELIHAWYKRIGLV
ncbi:hypothetical protein HHL11_31740 [Ramlibacter sp. G-1-2-2]|uniref:Uncharacterized protein n=1 Tax=Ramlibacter agri TaxID=2728837 RepID=A0A848HDW4_9BURK|nr:hypothetical protein [Ramlibacter agri]NML48362.1 hypothetical protein [Ramlibacter agri]